jgi:transposase-like protein
VYDATYFHKDGCLMSLMDATNQKMIASIYVQKESFKHAYPWFIYLKNSGFSPSFVTTDGEQSILRAMRLVWPQASLQRCLYHLQHEGMRWLRTYPKTEAGKSLRSILASLSSIKTFAERDEFVLRFQSWKNNYKSYVLSLLRTQVAFKDLKRTMGLINNALPDMFYYLEDLNIHSTTNALEGFHSRLKSDYQRHRGLSKKHKLQYLRWYGYFENTN